MALAAMACGSEGAQSGYAIGEAAQQQPDTLYFPNALDAAVTIDSNANGLRWTDAQFRITEDFPFDQRAGHTSLEMAIDDGEYFPLVPETSSWQPSFIHSAWKAVGAPVARDRYHLRLVSSRLPNVAVFHMDFVVPDASAPITQHVHEIQTEGA